jgi:hypothetical protein
MSDKDIDDEIDAMLSGKDTGGDLDEVPSTEPEIVSEVVPKVSRRNKMGIKELIAKAHKQKKRIRVIINEGAENDTVDVFLSVNGRACQIQRGVEVDLRPEYVECLANAVQARLKKVGGEQGTYVTKEFPRHSFQVLGLVDGA